MTEQVQLSALRAACVTGNFTQLYNLRADVNKYDERGGFLLMRFLEIEPFTTTHVDMLSHLIIDLKADVNLSHKLTGKTALHCAACLGNLAAVKILIEKDAAVNSRDNFQSTPLTYCAPFAGNSEVIKHLLLNDALVDAVTLSGQTALHFAIDHNQIENARVLLMHADRGICDRNGKNPLQIAKNKAMRDLFSRTIDQLRLEVDQQKTERIGILLTKDNPLQEAIESSNLSEAKSLMEDLKFTPNHLDKGFEFAFRNRLLENYNFIFNLFSENLPSNSLVKGILNNKLIELKNLQNEIETVTKEEYALKQPDTRTADDFDVGRGDFADRAMAITGFRNHLLLKDEKERLRVAKLKEKNVQIQFLSKEKLRINNQIEVLKKFQCFNPVIDPETGIQELAINDDI